MPSSTPGAALPLDGLAAVAELVATTADPAGEPACVPGLVRLRLVGEEVELGWLPLRRGEHPADALMGAQLPDDWAAVGVAAPGRLRHLDRSDPPVPVRTAHLVARDGSWASCWVPDVPDPEVVRRVRGDELPDVAAAAGEDGGQGPVAAGDVPAWAVATVLSGRAGDRGCPMGRVDDACRRALGLPTAPPPATTADLWALTWLDRVVRAVADGCPAGWARLARLHPAVDAFDRGGDRVPTPGELAELAGRLVALRDWEALRQAAAAGTWQAPDLAPPIAAWMDAGSFSRWVLGAYPDLADLRAMAAAVLPTAVAEAVDRVLGATAAPR